MLKSQSWKRRAGAQIEIWRVRAPPYWDQYGHASQKISQCSVSLHRSESSSDLSRLWINICVMSFYKIYSSCFLRFAKLFLKNKFQLMRILHHTQLRSFIVLGFSFVAFYQINVFDFIQNKCSWSLSENLEFTGFTNYFKLQEVRWPHTRFGKSPLKPTDTFTLNFNYW